MSRPTDAERVARLEQLLLVEMPDHALAVSALTHKSYCNEHRDEACADNERLEWLGDAVIDLAISARLMERFPTASEGELSKLRALIVNEEALAKITRKVGLGELLQLGRGEELTGGRDKSSVLADALEAVIGAVFLAGGLVKVTELVDRFFDEVFAGLADGSGGHDYKTMLQEDVQNRLRVSPRYQVVAESGPDHAKIFEVEVTIGADAFARSTGRSKKEAEQAAAQKTLAMLLVREKPVGGTGDAK